MPSSQKLHVDRDPRKTVTGLINLMKDVSDITKYLSAVHPFSEEQLSLFTDKLYYRNLRKKEFLKDEHQVSDSITFIQAGSFRFYKKLDNGELTIKFFIENSWVADLESLLTQQPSKNCIEAIEDSAIASITLRDIHVLMDAHPCFRMLNVILAELTIPASYVATINSKSPDERYQEILQKHPEWINRFPQMQIASYLGMTPETLSRVRARVK